MREFALRLGVAVQLLDAHYLVKYHRLCMGHSVVSAGRPETIANTIGHIAQHTHQTGTADHHMLPRIRTEAGRRRLCHDAVREYGRLPFRVGARDFRRHLRRHLLKEQNGRV